MAVMELSAQDVASRLRLGPEYAAWLQTLDSLGAPPGGLPSPSVEAFDLTSLQAEDREALRSALPDEDTPAEWRWLLGRAYHAVRTDMDDPEGVRPMPALPMELGARARCFWIVVFLAAVADIRRWHRAHGVSDQISADTLADVGRHVRLFRERNGFTGLDTQWWLSLHFRGALFGIGRLQYQPFHLQTGLAGPLFWYAEAAAAERGPGFKRGDPVLGLHIPEAGPLTSRACADSFREAAAFFNEHFTEYSAAIAVCTSWLLDDQLLAYLESDSNIVAFQRRFELVPGWRESDASAFHFVFGTTADAIDTLDPRTTLERAIVQHVRSGAHWGLRTGWLRLTEQTF
jgi:hypothetical protein